MKRLFNILVFLYLSFSLSAQEETRVVDSIINAMNKQEGYERAETMQELSRAFFDISFDDCIYYGEKAVQESAAVGDKGLLAQAYWKLGLSYLNHYDFDLAHFYFNQASHVLKNTNDTEILMYVLDYKGYVELFMGEMDSALITYQQALKVSENIGDELNSADVFNSMAYIHFQQDSFDKAMDCFREARKRYERVQDTLSMAQCDNNISNIYVQWQQFDEALSLLQRVIPIFEQNDDEASLAHAYQNMGTIYATGHVNLDSALVYLHKSIECAEMVGDQITLVEDEIELANLLKLLHRNSEAISLYQSALHSSETMGFLNGMLGAYKNIGIYYNEAGDFTTSAIYLKRCMDLATEKGNLLYANSVRPYLIADYAHLGHFSEMSKELGMYRDNYESIVGESNALEEELTHLSENVEGLLNQYESQNEQIETLQSSRNHYRMALYGLLAIVLFAVILWLLRIILLNNRKRLK